MVENKIESRRERDGERRSEYCSSNLFANIYYSYFVLFFVEYFCLLRGKAGPGWKGGEECTMTRMESGGSATLSGCGVTLFMLHCFIVIPRRRCRPRCCCCCLGNETHRKVDKKATTKCECEMCKEVGRARRQGERGKSRAVRLPLKQISLKISGLRNMPKQTCWGYQTKWRP